MRYGTGKSFGIVKGEYMKKGIVVEGGGIRAIFISGCFDALLDYGVEVDYIIGASAGITYAMSYISKQKGRNLEVVVKYANDKRYMGFNNFFDKNSRSYFGVDFAFRTIPQELVPFDYATFNEYKGEAYAVLSNVATGEAEYVNLVNNPDAEDYVIATCSLPYMFPEKEINGKKYLDGGICDAIPIQKALSDGLDKTLVLLTREKNYRKKESKYSKILAKLDKRENLVKSLQNRAKKYNFSLEIIDELEAKGLIKVIRPTDTKNFSRTEKDLDKIKALYQEGYDTIAQNIEEIKAYLEL